MFGFKLEDDSIFTSFEEYELQHPVPRKEVDTDGRMIYTSMSQELKAPRKISEVILGSLISGTRRSFNLRLKYTEHQTVVILDVPWTFSVDIWNVGCMIWAIYESESLFSGKDAEFEQYRSQAHLAEMINLLGPPPSLLAQGELRDKFFPSEGKFFMIHAEF
ncbi:uncharacterized protein N7483_002259 [Penicillium malachiteum]|uniref:uncharacterized protein n=1 Tax=Penicillium malachiteum TaxID=1324776 RepID=UPI002546717F|nr:uncharacterized protein N7483_002259 [Penicillium malachiteum]KAJ5737134.1 hypothetical protein N7483_002259 [Penicillium malachiteum]